ncbi:Microtubule binding Kinesin motor domain [Trypanosoma vivax]|uniref:Kinesin-like protein n=1 Tax=Trypanosoma vivax (strain Y486) TaxID=1055687 RepID=G0TUR2_TRYVY|nr:Microtubule binding Kinesin motor domain [Trypanosoma vivax]CCC47697.1 putative mitotic centromere-associated kinesin [Trypanosoma vivax Y486]
MSLEQVTGGWESPKRSNSNSATSLGSKKNANRSVSDLSSPLWNAEVPDASPPQDSRHSRIADSSEVPSLVSLHRQLDGLSRDLRRLNPRGRTASTAVIPDLPGQHQCQQPSAQIVEGAKQAQSLAKQPLPYIPSMLSGRSIASPVLAKVHSPTNQADEFPSVSPRSLKEPRAASPDAKYANPGAEACSPQISNGRSFSCSAAEEVSMQCEPKNGPPLTGRTRGGRIKVVVRKRPLPPDDNSGSDCVSIDPPCVHIAMRKQRVDLTEYADINDFTFDDAFAEDKCNEYLFNSCCKELLDATLQGGSASCFAYGQTGSGKTHTMLGNSEERGLYVLAAASIFSSLEENQEVYASLYEIYCNSLFDLLNNRTPVVVREDHKRRMHISGLTWHAVSSAELLQQLINNGTDRRSTGSTTANERSSRSHAVLTIQVRHQDDPKFCGTLNMVDLAGSERAADTATTDRQTRQEGAEINKSLLALKECIRALDEKKKHVPFRGSKLTEILRDSFIGNSRTVMIANISASSQNYEHTLNTLRYAFRVKGLSVATFEPSRARNAPRPARPVAADVPQLQPPVAFAAAACPGNVSGAVGARNTPARKCTVSVAAPVAGSRQSCSVVPAVSKRHGIFSSTMRGAISQLCNVNTCPSSSLTHTKTNDSSCTDCFRALARQKIMSITPQIKVSDRSDECASGFRGGMEGGSPPNTFTQQQLRDLEERVLAQLSLDMEFSVKQTLLRRDRTLQRLRRENTVLRMAVVAMEKKIGRMSVLSAKTVQPCH